MNENHFHMASEMSLLRSEINVQNQLHKVPDA